MSDDDLVTHLIVDWPFAACGVDVLETYGSGSPARFDRWVHSQDLEAERPGSVWCPDCRAKFVDGS